MRLTGIRLGTTPAALRRLGLATDGDRAGVGGVTIEAAGDAPDDAPGGMLGLALSGAAADPPLPLVDVEPVPDGDHPLGATAVDHVVVLAGDVEAAVRDLGATARRSEERDGRRYAFVVAGTALLEFVGPAVPGDRPPHLWGLALTVADLDAAVALLGDACGTPKDAVQPGRRIATVRHDAIGLGVPTVLLSAR